MARVVLFASALVAASALRSHPLVSVAATFPRFETVDELIVGKPVSIVVGFINRGDRVLNVSRISGHVVDAVTGVVLQNLSSALIVDGAVDGGTESAFEFVLTPTAPETTMAQIGLAIYYTDKREHYGTAFYNGTVTLVRHETAFAGVGSALPYLLGLSLAGALMYLLKDAILPSKAELAEAAAAAPAKAPVGGADEEEVSARADASQARRRKAAVKH